MKQKETREYLVKYIIGFTYYDQDPDQEEKGGFHQERYFQDIHEARRYVQSLPEECENISIYRLVEEYTEE